MTRKDEKRMRDALRALGPLQLAHVAVADQARTMEIALTGGRDAFASDRACDIGDAARAMASRSDADVARYRANVKEGGSVLRDALAALPLAGIGVTALAARRGARGWEVAADLASFAERACECFAGLPLDSDAEAALALTRETMATVGALARASAAELAAAANKAEAVVNAGILPVLERADALGVRLRLAEVLPKTVIDVLREGVSLAAYASPLARETAPPQANATPESATTPTDAPTKRVRRARQRTRRAPKMPARPTENA